MTLRTRDYDPSGDARDVAALWERVFGARPGGQTIEWLFRDGPAGSCPRAVVEKDGRIVSHLGAMALRFTLCGRPVMGGYTVAAMTDASMRGQGLFVEVSKHLHRRCEEHGFAFLAGFSNANSIGPTSGPIGRTPVRPFPWAVRLLRPGGMLRDLIGKRPTALAADSSRAPEVRESSGVREIAPADDALDDLWEATAKDVEIGAIRDRAFSEWRFGDRPDAGYRVFLAESGGRPAAYAAYRYLPFRGVRSAFLVDLLVAPGHGSAGRRLVREVARLARRQGAVLLSALLPGEGVTRSVLGRSGFFPIPAPFHPQSIVFTVRGFGSVGDIEALTRATSWFYTWADIDIV